ncbi:cytochrome P450 [Exophiala viscosa]|uniref:Cytochrome P450 n=1 Tax=Exophiala viscosa TaxID=2486360 RepID=A0AAN6E7S3_9EURO|nr:cytochrome P450 [Exophiala viscosa]
MTCMVSGNLNTVSGLVVSAYSRPVVRIAPSQYSTDDPVAVSVLYGAGNPFIKIIIWKPEIQASDITLAFRRKVADAYSMSIMVSLGAFVDSCTQILLQKLQFFARNGIAIDVPHWTQCYAFDVIEKLTFGDRFGFLDEGKDIQGIMASLHQYLGYAARVGVYSEWHKWAYLAAGIAHVAVFALQRIDKRLRSEASGKTQRERDQQRRYIAVCVANVGAGSDTTSISLNAVLYCLCKNPPMVQKLRDEITTKRAQGELSEPVAFQQGQSMPYLQTVIKKGLRMRPAAGYPLMRVVPREGATIAGHTFPPGGHAILGINPWVAHANQAVFGEDACNFLVKRREAYFLTFGAGSRTCIGKNISFMEMTKEVPEVIEEFDLELEPPTCTWKTANVWFVKQTDFRCRIRRCAQSTHLGRQ